MLGKQMKPFLSSLPKARAQRKRSAMQERCETFLDDMPRLPRSIFFAS
jgi:hypothetical protein